jgi:hypothetical protein
MSFSEEFLRKLCEQKVCGDFEPFKSNNQDLTEGYIRKKVETLEGIKTLNVKADFDHFGSGYASFVEIRISKADKSDTETVYDEDGVIEHTNGLVICVCRLSPYWYYGGIYWGIKYVDGKIKASASSMPYIGSINNLKLDLWKDEVKTIEAIFERFNYTLLTFEQLDKELWFDVFIPTLLPSEDDPLKVFDCFFYWED